MDINFGSHFLSLLIFRCFTVFGALDVAVKETDKPDIFLPPSNLISLPRFPMTFFFLFTILFHGLFVNFEVISNLKKKFARTIQMLTPPPCQVSG